MRRCRERQRQSRTSRGTAGPQSGCTIEGSPEERSLSSAIRRARISEGAAGRGAAAIGDDAQYRREVAWGPRTLEPVEAWERRMIWVEAFGFGVLIAAGMISAAWSAGRYLFSL